jgi:hypothetical protein
MMAVTFAADIRLLFTDRDVTCMSDNGVQLRDYGYMSDPAPDASNPDHANARAVLERLLPAAGRRRMPKGGPYWSDAQIDLYRRWMADGFQA